MRMIWILGGAVLVILALAVGFRLVPSDPGVWHVDPATAPGTQRPNAWRIGPDGMEVPADAPAPVFRATATELARAIDAVALAEPRTRRLAGDPDSLWTTYVQRSRLMGYPDYVSVRVIDLGDGRATLALYSRARFGYSDMGVNSARVARWMAGLGLPPG